MKLDDRGRRSRRDRGSRLRRERADRRSDGRAGGDQSAPTTAASREARRARTVARRQRRPVQLKKKSAMASDNRLRDSWQTKKSAEDVRRCNEAKEAAAKLTPRDKKTMSSIVGLADRVVDCGRKAQGSVRRYPLAHARRTSTTARGSGFIEMGNATNRRQLFDLSQAKAYMQTMLVASGCKKLLDARQDDQPPGSVLHAQAHDRRHQGKHVRRSGRVRHDHRRHRSAARQRSAKSCTCTPRSAATMVGNITLIDSGDEIDCSRMGSGGYAIPSIVEPEVIQFDPRSATRSSSCTSKRARSGSGSTKTSSGRSTTASSPTAAASRRAACGGCCTACTTN